jgi:hypothetical protein
MGAARLPGDNLAGVQDPEDDCDNARDCAADAADIPPHD